MSRIDQAWRRASGALLEGADDAATPESLEAQAAQVLYEYPREAGVFRLSPEAREQLSRRAKAAPHAASRREVAVQNVAFDRKLLGGAKPRALAVEQYRRLGGAVQDLQAQHGRKTLMVTSAQPGDGKTLTVAHLALTLSESFGRRVLLIDADMRQPSLHTLFGLQNTRGLSDVLLSERDRVSLQKLSANLSVLPAGRPDANTMAALTSDRMEDLLEQLSAEFDWVLLDTAPHGSTPDGELLARLTGGVLFVVGARSTPVALVERAVAAIGREWVVGVVLNRVDDGKVPVAADGAPCHLV